MLQNIAPEITIASFSIIGVLTGYVWNDQNKRICEIEKNQKDFPLIGLTEDISQMKTDIEWIKKYLIKN
jgi:hypothetical protein